MCRTKEQLFNIICEDGAICTPNNNELRILKELEQNNLIISCDKINHSKEMLNPSYTYVTNDEKGKKLALNPLFTRIL